MITYEAVAASLIGLMLVAGPIEAQRSSTGRPGRDNNRWEDSHRDRVSNYRNYRYNGPARDYGYRDGYDLGRKDGRDRDRYDPYRNGRYKSANRGYDRDYGSRDRYRAVYRQAFAQGYAAGYRSARASGRRW